MRQNLSSLGRFPNIMSGEHQALLMKHGGGRIMLCFSVAGSCSQIQKGVSGKPAPECRQPKTGASVHLLTWSIQPRKQWHDYFCKWVFNFECSLGEGVYILHILEYEIQSLRFKAGNKENKEKSERSRGTTVNWAFFSQFPHEFIHWWCRDHQSKERNITSLNHPGT